MRPALLVIALTSAMLLTACSSAKAAPADHCSEIYNSALSHLQQATADTTPTGQQQLDELIGINLALDNPECFSEEAVAAAKSRKEQILNQDSTAP